MGEHIHWRDDADEYFPGSWKKSRNLSGVLNIIMQLNRSELDKVHNAHQKPHTYISKL